MEKRKKYRILGKNKKGVVIVYNSYKTRREALVVLKKLEHMGPVNEGDWKFWLDKDNM